MRNWIWGGVALIAISGCDPEPEGQRLQVPTESQALQQEQRVQQETAFRPGIYQGNAEHGTGTISIRAEFRADKEATITRNIVGAKPKAEVMKGSYRIVDNIVEVSVTEVNGEASQFPVFFFEESNGVSTQDIADGITVTVFLPRILEDTSAPGATPPANAPAKPPTSPSLNSPPTQSPSNAPATPLEPVIPLAGGSGSTPNKPKESPEGGGPLFEGV